MRLLYLHNESLDFQRANVLQVLNMCKAFANHGVATTLALAGDEGGETSMAQRINREFGKVSHLQLLAYRKVTIANRLKVLGSYYGVRKLLRRVTTDICFARDPLMCALAVQRGFATIYESHNARFHNQSALLNNAWDRWIGRLMQRPNFLGVIAISNALATVWLERGVPREKILTLHDGFDPALFSQPHTQAQARAQLGLEGPKPLIVYTGSLYRDRGIDSILVLAERIPTCQFVVVGGPEDARLRYQRAALARGLDNIIFTGRVPHTRIPAYLAAADVLLMVWSRQVPTIAYCSPMKVFEYMAAGRAIVGHGFPTIREVLTDGVTAYLANPDSIDDLQAKLEQAVRAGYPSPLAERARAEALERYSWHARAGAILEYCRRRDKGSELDPARRDLITSPASGYQKERR